MNPRAVWHMATARKRISVIVPMKFERKFVFAFCLCILIPTVGCDQFLHKKKTASLPPRTVAPTIPTNLPEGIPVPSDEPAPVAVAEEPAPATVSKPAPKPHHRSTKKATPTTNAANGTSGTTTIVANHAPQPPPAPDTAIAADLSTDRAAKDQQTTAELLDSAEKTVKGLDDHSLSDDQKAMVSQILSYINQSRKATSDGDIERAFNLANKAHLLSDALVKK